MTSMDILNAIGMVDEKCVANVKKRKGIPKNVLVTIVSFAACFGLIFIIPKVKNFTEQYAAELEESIRESHAAEYPPSVAVVTTGDVTIYYVDGDKISSYVYFMSLKTEDIFREWRVKHGIGEEVKLIDYEILSNATTSSFEFQGKEYYLHTMGDYFICNITVSESLKNYFDKMDSELLLESLKKTLVWKECDEVYILYQ